MATPPAAVGGSGGAFGKLKRVLGANYYVYLAMILTITGGAIVLMTVPAELMTDAPKDGVLDLTTTFATLKAKGWLSLALILLGFLLMVFDLVGADLAMNLVLALMVTFKVISIKSALIGFGNSGLMTVVILFIVAQGITSTGGADWIITKILGTPSDTMLAQVRMCLVTAAFSSFVNDTPVFCIMLPIILTWAAKARLPVRQLLIPLSYCCLLGGLNTTIGTSTNLVVTGQFATRVLDPASAYYQQGVKAIQLFGITPYGIPNTIFGIIYIVYLAPFLLVGGAGSRVFSKFARTFTTKKTADEGAALFDQGGDFFIGLLVTSGSAAIGKSLEDAGLRHLDGVYLTSVRRNSKIIHAVGSDFIVAAGDVLYFSGVPDSMEEIAATHGLVPYTDAVENVDASDIPGVGTAFGVDKIQLPRSSPTNGSDNSALSLSSYSPPELVQATIKRGASISGQTIRASAFRGRFHAAVISIKRDGLPLPWTGPNIGDEVLQASDQLLLDVDPQFWTTPEVNDTFEDIGKSGQVKSHNEFMLPMRVTRLLSGKTVQQSGLRQLPNAFLVSIDRASSTLHAVSPDEQLQEGDVVWFAANPGSVRFIRNTPGLVTLGEKHATQLSVQHVDRRLVQAIVATNSPLAGRTIRDVQFRQQFNAAVVAVARKGERIHAKPGDIQLQSGDILLLDCGPAFAQTHKDSKFFSIVIEMDNTNPPRYIHTGICIVLVATAFLLYGLEILDILVGAAIVAMTMLLTGCLSADQARSAIRWDVYLMIAGSFGVSAGLEQSGGAAAIANLIINIGRKAGGSGMILGCIYVATTLLSQIVSNNSAAALVFPIAATISKNDGVDIYLLSYAVMLGASSVFMSSFGYQTNLMALAAGGHSSRDFLKFGSPMQVVLAVVSIAVLMAGVNDKLTLVWIVTAVAGAVALSLPQIVDLVHNLKNKKKT